MSGHHSKDSEQTCSPFKTVLRKIGDKYQAYCTTCKTHTMATHHGGPGHPLDRDTDLCIKYSETTGLENDNENTSDSDATDALGGPEAEGHSNGLIHNNQGKLMALTREINDLCQ